MSLNPKTIVCVIMGSILCYCVYVFGIEPRMFLAKLERIQLETQDLIQRANRGEPKAFEDMLARSRSPDQYVRIQSVSRLPELRFRRNEVVSALMEAACHQDHSTVRSALISLDDMGEAARPAVNLLIRLLHSGQGNDVSAFAATALSHAADAEQEAIRSNLIMAARDQQGTHAAESIARALDELDMKSKHVTQSSPHRE